MAQYTQINPDALVTALTPINNSLGGKQDKTDSTLSTTDKTVSGAINEINTKVGNLTGALTWKGKFDTLPAVTDYEAGNVVGVGNKEYVLTVTGSTKAWEELGDEGSYLLKSVAEETYLKKAAGEVKSTNLANNAVTKEKLSTDVQSSLDKADNSLQKGNVAAPTSDTDAVNKSYVDGKTENLLTNDDSLNLNVPIIIYTSTDDDSIAANKANISFYLKFWEKYTSRITDTTFSDPNIRRPSNTCFIPTILSVSKSNNIALGTGIIFGISGVPDISYYNGIFRATSMSDSTHDGSYKIVSINANTGKLESASQLISSNISYSKFNTTAKDIFGAINEVNTLAKSKGNGTITEVKMNGVSKGTSGVVDLGTVLTEHQDISGKVDKTTLLNTLMVVDLSSDDIAVRKAALDDFKAKWLALGNTDLTGARFIGRFSDANGNTSIHESGKFLLGEDTLLIYKQISPAFPTGFYGLSYIKDMANTMCGLYQIYVDYDNTNPGNIEITQIRDSETLDLLNRFVYAEVPSTYLKITDAESTYAKKTSIPTVNDPKVSIKMNGAEKGSFTLNQASAGEVDLGTVITAHQDISGKVDKTLNAKAFEGITIRTTNSAEDEAANVAAIQAYVNNLNMLGVDTTKGFNVPVIIVGNSRDFYGCLTGRYIAGPDGYFLSGTIFSVTGGENYVKDIYIGPSGYYSDLVNIKNDNNLNTTSKDLIGAINEVNTLAKSKGNGTITGVRMNGVSKGTSGVVDLGTVITAHQDISGKQDKLVSGMNIKTINGESVLGSGDITITSSGGAYPEVNHGTGDTTFTLTPNTFHVWDEVTSLTLNFGNETNGVANEYLFQFTSGSTATSLTLPDDIKWANDNAPTIGANMIYQVSVLRGLASVLEFNNPIVFPIIGDTGGNANEEYAKVYEYFVSTYNLTSVSDSPSKGVIITETLICNDANYGGRVLKVSLSGTMLLLWTQNAIDRYTVPTINNLGVYYNHYWD